MSSLAPSKLLAQTHYLFSGESESESHIHVWFFETTWNSPWNSPGQNIGVGSLSLLQEIFPIQGSNQGLLHCWFFTSWATREAVFCYLPTYWGAPFLSHSKVDWVSFSQLYTAWDLHINGNNFCSLSTITSTHSYSPHSPIGQWRGANNLRPRSCSPPASEDRKSSCHLLKWQELYY